MTNVQDVLSKFKNELEKRTPEERVEFLRSLGYDLAEEPTEYIKTECFSQDVFIVHVGNRDSYHRTNRGGKDIKVNGYNVAYKGVA